MVKSSYTIKGKVWVYPGMAGWHFFTIPRKESTQIKETYKGMHKGWGSLPTTVTVGKTVWKTSIFPESTSDTYLLPLKKEVRTKEGIGEGDTISVQISL